MEISGVMINPAAIGLCGIAAFLLGYVWYAVLFSAPWQEAQRFTAEQKKDLGKMAPMTMAISFVGYLVTAVVLALLLGFAKVTDFNTAVYISFLAWLGFSVSMGLMHSLYGGRSLVGFAIDIGYELLYVVGMAFILTWWK